MSALAWAVCFLALVAGATGMMKPAAMTPVKRRIDFFAKAFGTGHEAVRQTCSAIGGTQPSRAPLPGLLETDSDVDFRAGDLRREEEEGARKPFDKHFCPKEAVTVHDHHAIVLPEYKLSFCFIPKIGSTDFKDLFNTINGVSPLILGFGKEYSASKAEHLGVNESEITKSNGWKFAVFTRDPALRYLSAFGDTCIRGDGHRRHRKACCGPTLSKRAPKEEMTKHFQARLKRDLEEGLAHNVHWSPQTEIIQRCGWGHFRPERLDYWGVLSGDVHGQVKEMLGMVGYTNDTVISKFFPKDHVAGHHSALQGGPEDYINDLDTLAAITKLYQDDFHNLPGVGCSFSELLYARLTANRTGSAQRRHHLSQAHPA
uniref:Carbohydrate sulfotransferase n=1 Tax=Alexandrium monilatum TaxID=311494 RepID=A0A6T1IFW2_9DINO|mmetsp:Transcript_69144/g.205773  ORF Transcript_69144/g.205773 Transcript_69144/m.205773 type:complete len:372 (-) Transcript_69144:90-1205(-)